MKTKLCTHTSCVKLRLNRSVKDNTCCLVGLVDSWHVKERDLIGQRFSSSGKSVFPGILAPNIDVRVSRCGVVWGGGGYGAPKSMLCEHLVVS